MGSNCGKSSPDILDVRVEMGSPAPSEHDCQMTMIGAGNFGLPTCSKEDFMQINSSMMDALSRAEAQLADDDEFAEAILAEIDLLFDEFEMLKHLLVRAHRGDTYAHIERDALPIKQKLQLGINEIVSRINEREMMPKKKRWGKSIEDTAAGSNGRGIETLKVEGLGYGTRTGMHSPLPSARRSVPITDFCGAFETLDLT
jgi:hypothetical protein